MAIYTWCDTAKCATATEKPSIVDLIIEYPLAGSPFLLIAKFGKPHEAFCCKLGCDRTEIFTTWGICLDGI